ncbi:MAG: sigma-E processing peptidase SpoIIGA [Eubacteriales bacterium]|nr:sigma-E processing peptidase SpoIIGA [Eubacteriales bacterium]
MKYSLYIDRIFFLHFFLNFWLLLLTARLGGLDVRLRRLIWSAGEGALWFVLMLAAPLAGKALLLPGGSLAVLWLAFGFRRLRSFARAAALYAACACVLGGAVGAAQGLTGLWGKTADLLTVLFWSGLAAGYGIRLIARERRRQRSPLWQVRLRQGQRRAECIALADSGNSLCDPFTGGPVCLADAELAEKLGLLRDPEKVRLIPYHSVGKRHGLLRAVTLEEMYVEKEGQEKRMRQVTVAVSPQPLSAAGRYRLLLHPTLLEEQKGANHDIESSNAGKNAV